MTIEMQYVTVTSVETESLSSGILATVIIVPVIEAVAIAALITFVCCYRHKFATIGTSSSSTATLSGATGGSGVTSKPMVSASVPLTGNAASLHAAASPNSYVAVELSPPTSPNT